MNIYSGADSGVPAIRRATAKAAVRLSANRRAALMSAKAGVMVFHISTPSR